VPTEFHSKVLERRSVSSASSSRDERPGKSYDQNRGATWLGLFVALFGMLIVRTVVYAFYPPYSFPAAAWRESLNWLCAIVLLLIIRFGERLPFRSVGIGRASIQSSLAWGGVIAVVCAVLAFGIAALTHYTAGHRARPSRSSRSG
jgi:hypothetical protein